MLTEELSVIAGSIISEVGIEANKLESDSGGVVVGMVVGDSVGAVVAAVVGAVVGEATCTVGENGRAVGIELAVGRGLALGVGTLVDVAVAVGIKVMVGKGVGEDKGALQLGAIKTGSVRVPGVLCKIRCDSSLACSVVSKKAKPKLSLNS